MAAPHPALAQQQDIPRLPNGHPDFSGIWQTLSEADYDLEPHSGRRDAPPSAGVVAGGNLPYRAEALSQRQANFANRAKDDPRLKCWTLGVPRSVYYPAPFQIFERERDITLVHQFGHQVRTINTNGTGHPKDIDEPYWLGDSRGHWEGDTLVVDVTEFNDETWLDRAGNYHSEDLHVVEKWSFVDRDTIRYSATIDDPKVYAKPWNLSVLLNRRRDDNFQLIEDYCFTLPYDNYYPHKEGK
ncbi:hypothetical protein H7F51_07955 [Novosphingobium flavum]|uniref:Uncharacterized protein n=1 Tax=Novosphingobium flavum TaxID=1778672 RepID=A0A7X1FSC0_9SPHN|nr:hypothetical protein [Novosphingobium flavum]